MSEELFIMWKQNSKAKWYGQMPQTKKYFCRWMAQNSKKVKCKNKRIIDCRNERCLVSRSTKIEEIKRKVEENQMAVQDRKSGQKPRNKRATSYLMDS